MTAVLDHGYLKLVSHMGSDQSIIEAARMSTGKGFLGWDPSVCECVAVAGQQPGVGPQAWADPDCLCCNGKGELKGDKHLLAYLYRNNHATPFEMGNLIIEVKAPLLVFREWMRHRTQSYNEMSARYIPIPDEHYVPSVERLMMGGGGSNKQAQGTGSTLTREKAKWFRQQLIVTNQEAQDLYSTALDAGIPKELARCPMPVNRYSKMRASANLRNWLGFMTLRCDAKAQWEIRQYANEVAKIVEEKFPRTYALWAEKVAA